jgi:hypothetical protein
VNSQQLQLKTAYEVEELSPLEIAESQGLEVASVKALLMNCSSKYRKDCGMENPEEDRLNFSDNDLLEANNVIRDVMHCAIYPDGSIDYKTRGAMATYIRDDKKGRKEIVRAMRDAGPTNILMMFNEQIGHARELAKKAKQKLIEA